MALNWRLPLPGDVLERTDTDVEEDDDAERIEANRDADIAVDIHEEVPEGDAPERHQEPPPLHKPEPPAPYEPPPQPDPIIRAQRDAMAAASQALHDVMAPAGNGAAEDTSIIFADASAWRVLLDRLAALSIIQRNVIRDEIIRRTLPFLPEPKAINVLRQDFLEERGAVTVIGLLDDELKLSQHQAALARLCGVPVAMRYLRWLEHSNDLRALDRRRADGHAAYRDSNGIAVIPREDLGQRIWSRPTAETDADTKACLEAAQRSGRWPRAIRWRTVFFPCSDLAHAGLPVAAFVQFGVEMWALSSLGEMEATPGYVPHWALIAGWLAIVAICHLPVAFAIRRLAIWGAMRRIRRADARWLVGKPRSDAIAVSGTFTTIWTRLAIFLEFIVQMMLAVTLIGAIDRSAFTPATAAERDHGSSMISLGMVSLFVFRVLYVYFYKPLKK